MPYRNFETNPINLDSEISILYELGLRSEEVSHLIHEKEKHDLAERWI